MALEVFNEREDPALVLYPMHHLENILKQVGKRRELAELVEQKEAFLGRLPTQEIGKLRASAIQ